MAWQVDFQVEVATPSIEFVDPPTTHPCYGLSVNVPIDAERMPTRCRLKRPWTKAMPDVFRAPGLNAVSEKFKNLVEQFEPAVHQFFPLLVEDRDGVPLNKQLFIFNCAVGVDAIIFRSCEPTWITYDFSPPLLRAGMGELFELSRPAIGNHHIWCGKTVAENKLFVSDAFYAAVPSGTFEAKYREELEEPWSEEDIAPLLQWRLRRH